MISLIKNIFIKILYVLLLTYLIIFIPIFWGYKPLVVISGSMEPILKVGGILYYKEYNKDNFKQQDILVYQAKNHIISHRVVKKYNDSYITKGDANKKNDSLLVNKNQILGLGTNWSIPYIGYYADYIYHHKIVLFICILIIINDFILDYLIKKVGNTHKKNKNTIINRTLNNSINKQSKCKIFYF